MSLSATARCLLDEIQSDEDAMREIAQHLALYLSPTLVALLTVDQAAERLGCNRDTLTRWAREGRIAATKVGREWRFEADKLEVAPVPGSAVFTPTRVAPRSRAGVGLRAVDAMRALTR